MKEADFERREPFTSTERHKGITSLRSTFEENAKG
jgi:hypothetical protein